MNRQSLKLLLEQKELNDIVQNYIDKSNKFDGEVISAYRGKYSHPNNKKQTVLTLTNSKTFGGNAEITLEEDNSLITDALSLWVSESNLPFVIHDVEAVRLDNREMELLWSVNVRTK